MMGAMQYYPDRPDIASEHRMRKRDYSSYSIIARFNLRIYVRTAGMLNTTRKYKGVYDLIQNS
jgi:hypothetical protein